ncbi:MAG: DUF1320 family protein [Planctomycetaceae bacterium]|nr:DUF1320 family protein [Planctomycetaceae bacterium]
MAYCTITEVQDILSSEGVVQATNDDGAQSAAQSTMVTNAIARATAKMNQYLTKKYDPATIISANDWIKWCCATFAARELMMRRGGVAPTGVQIAYDDYLKWLEEVANGTADIPGLTPRFQPGMTMSNMTIDHRFPVGKVRSVPVISVGSSSSEVPRHTDPTVFTEPH